MATPTPEEQAGEAFEAAVAEAVETAVMAFRLVMAIADAVRRARLGKAGQEEELPSVPESLAEASGPVGKLLAPDIGSALLRGADWPQLAQQLVALHRAGVDMQAFLPRVGGIAVSVRDAVAANAGRVVRDGTYQWAELLRGAVPDGPVREAIISSPAWPEMAARMEYLHQRGVHVEAILLDAHAEGVGVDQALARVFAAGAVGPASRDAVLSYGPLTVGLDIPRDLNLKDREGALRQLGVEPLDNQRFVRLVREALPGGDEDADLLVGSRQWAFFAARMSWMERQGQSVEDHVARLAEYASWEHKDSRRHPTLRVVEAMTSALTRPLGDGPLRPGGGVNTAAARAQSTTVGPSKAAAKGGPSPSGTGVAQHREAGPSQGRGRVR
ncbi:hypothetical protein [Streptomyces tsukubensis]|uniref:hypothetical protein n=1 Tax=Streptomyces tsukubensis TaxID=83656 RepID=UPI00344F512F